MSEPDALEAAFALWHETGDWSQVCERFPDVAGSVADLISLRDRVGRLALDEPPLSAGQLDLPGFRVVRPLGKGGTGVVFEAVQESLNRRVAIKFLRPRDDSGALSGERLRREAQVLASLRHEGLVAVHDVQEVSGQAWLTMELVEGIPLSQAIAEARAGLKGGLPRDVFDRIQKVAPRFAILAEALEHAHQHGVIHRDVKPSNIILCPDGRLKLVDFGLALFPDAPRTTLPGHPIGTPATMSPEQARGEPTTGPHSDVFSLGATLYYAVTLVPPFDGAGFAATLAQVLAGRFRRPKDVLDGVPADLEAIILKAMAYDPLERYRSAAAMSQDLAAFAAGRPVTARPRSNLARAVSWTRSRRVALATVLLLACLVGTVWVLSGHSREQQTRLDRYELDDAVRGITQTMFGAAAAGEARESSLRDLLADVDSLLTLHPDEFRLHFLRAFALNTLGQKQLALLALHGHAAFRDRAEACLLEAKILEGTEEAEVKRNEALARPFDSSWAYLVAAMVDFFDHPRDAARYLDRSLALPDLGPVRSYHLYYRGLIRVRLNDLEGADEDLAAASALGDPLALSVRAGVAEAQERQEVLTRLKERLIAWVGDDFHRRLLAAHGAHLGRAAKLPVDILGPEPSAPEFARAWFAERLIYGASGSGRPEDLDIARRGSERFPTDTNIQHLAAHIFARYGEAERCRQAFHRAERFAPEGAVRPWLCHVEALRKLGLAEEARRVLEAAQQRGAPWARVLGHEAGLLVASGEIEQAAVVFRRILEKYPRNAWAHGGLGVCLQELGDLDAARPHLTRAYELNPADPTHVVLYARSRETLEDALSAYDRAIDGGLRDPVLYMRRGFLRATHARGSLEKAEQALLDLREATALAPESASAHVTLGMGLQLLGRRAEAVRAYEAGFDKPLDDASLVLEAAVRFHRLEQEDGAKTLRAFLLPLVESRRIPRVYWPRLAALLERIGAAREAALLLGTLRQVEGTLAPDRLGPDR